MDETTFDECYRATVRRLVQYAYAMCGDAEVAQDLAHEAYLRAWQRRRRLAGYEDLEAWLRLVVTRLSADRWRRLAVHRRTLARLRPPPPAPPPSDDTVLLVRALREIPARQRQAVVLHYLVGLSVADVATEIGTSAGTVKSWLARGRAALGAHLGGPAYAGKEHGDA
ncbi:sigma-70 family RNA polymerase sigma factor [Dactylosporangium aurantiacum]|uniref:Sigma-70 family RNA polymerase sigma factor n=1 Tax=Dactylosporangium aurantiacum TaxID=35754 RepID=A0A9Q9II81_9ACTN|nr:sigma-70 family RNA polymerase sigma factor [Dactylosporangium aurantiacum]MDG6104358.1 sigma-70 family RNA polymerase sigma factor [Dactylosporangium aurantiacum]UWZ56654.1 sigma-70 family RNA polymerase sigma factor [Dactylosporangium aurantiacum]